MAITFERADTIDDSIFDSLYSTSVDDIKSGTMLIPEDKTSDEDIKAWVKGIFNQESNSRHGILVKKDGTPINWIVGNHNPEDTFTWVWVLNGAINNSKAVFYTSEWHTNHKAYQQSIGVSKYSISCLVDSRVDKYFIKAQSDGVMLGNYSKKTYEDSPLNVRHNWEY
tara:strand:+ start:2434 stop:2937 length:504 start_codon:yes stop_codon:yes gene_type:complete